MNPVRKARVIHMYLVRTGYSDTAKALWLMLALANVDCKDKQDIIAWLNGSGSIDSFLNSILFLNTGTEIINIRLGFKSLKKLMAVLPNYGETK